MNGSQFGTAWNGGPGDPRARTSLLLDRLPPPERRWLVGLLRVNVRSRQDSAYDLVDFALRDCESYLSDGLAPVHVQRILQRVHRELSRDAMAAADVAHAILKGRVQL